MRESPQTISSTADAINNDTVARWCD